MEDYRLEQTGQEVQNILNGAAMQTDLAAETERATAAEQQLQGNIDAEKLARQNADAALQEYADGKVSDEAAARQQADELLTGNIDAEEFRAKAAEAANATSIEAINGKIPAEASAENKLVDNAALQGTYYTKDAVDNLIQGLGQNDIIVGALPASGVANTIYRVPGDGVYSDYMWYNGAWQLLATYSANIQGYQYIGIATPSANPGTPSNNVFYFAHKAGTYTNFGALVVTQGINILKFDGTSWTLEQLVGIAQGSDFDNPDAAKRGKLATVGAVLDGCDAEPTADSAKPVQSGGVFKDTPANNNHSIYESDFCIADESGFAILCLNDGHVISEKFDSNDVENLQSKEDIEADLDITDNEGNVILRLNEGHIETEKFNSENVENLQLKEDVESNFDITDNDGFVILRLSDGHIQTEKFNSVGHWVGKKWYGFGTSITNIDRQGRYATYLSRISGMIFVNKGHSGGGITTSSDQTIYNDVFNSNLNDADLITLEVGANDGNAPLGTIYDSLSNSAVQDNSTFCGALNLCIRHLQSTTSAQIVVISSPNSRYQYQHPENIYDGDETYGPDNHTITDRDESIRKVCMLNSCYCILAGSEDGMGYARMNASDDYVVDQIHQTELGGYNFAQAIWSKLKDIPLFYTQIPT